MPLGPEQLAESPATLLPWPVLLLSRLLAAAIFAAATWAAWNSWNAWQAPTARRRAEHQSTASADTTSEDNDGDDGDVSPTSAKASGAAQDRMLSDSEQQLGNASPEGSFGTTQPRDRTTGQLPGFRPHAASRDTALRTGRAISQTSPFAQESSAGAASPPSSAPAHPGSYGGPPADVGDAGPPGPQHSHSRGSSSLAAASSSWSSPSAALSFTSSSTSGSVMAAASLALPSGPAGAFGNHPIRSSGSDTPSQATPEDDLGQQQRHESRHGRHSGSAHGRARRRRGEHARTHDGTAAGSSAAAALLPPWDGGVRGQSSSRPSPAAPGTNRSTSYPTGAAAAPGVAAAKARDASPESTLTAFRSAHRAPRRGAATTAAAWSRSSSAVTESQQQQFQDALDTSIDSSTASLSLMCQPLHAPLQPSGSSGIGRVGSGTQPQSTAALGSSSSSSSRGATLPARGAGSLGGTHAGLLGPGPDHRAGLGVSTGSHGTGGSPDHAPVAEPPAARHPGGTGAPGSPGSPGATGDGLGDGVSVRVGAAAAVRDSATAMVAEGVGAEGQATTPALPATLRYQAVTSFQSLSVKVYDPPVADHLAYGAELAAAVGAVLLPPEPQPQPQLHSQLAHAPSPGASLPAGRTPGGLQAASAAAPGPADLLQALPAAARSAMGAALRKGGMVCVAGCVLLVAWMRSVATCAQREAVEGSKEAEQRAREPLPPLPLPPEQQPSPQLEPTGRQMAAAGGPMATAVAAVREAGNNAREVQGRASGTGTEPSLSGLEVAALLCGEAKGLDVGPNWAVQGPQVPGDAILSTFHYSISPEDSHTTHKRPPPLPPKVTSAAAAAMSPADDVPAAAQTPVASRANAVSPSSHLQQSSCTNPVSVRRVWPPVLCVDPHQVQTLHVHVHVAAATPLSVRLLLVRQAVLLADHTCPPLTHGSHVVQLQVAPQPSPTVLQLFLASAPAAVAGVTLDSNPTAAAGGAHRTAGSLQPDALTAEAVESSRDGGTYGGSRSVRGGSEACSHASLVASGSSSSSASSRSTMGSAVGSSALSDRTQSMDDPEAAGSPAAALPYGPLMYDMATLPVVPPDVAGELVRLAVVPSGRPRQQSVEPLSRSGSGAGAVGISGSIASGKGGGGGSGPRASLTSLLGSGDRVGAVNDTDAACAASSGGLADGEVADEVWCECLAPLAGDLAFLMELVAAPDGLVGPMVAGAGAPAAAAVAGGSMYASGGGTGTGGGGRVSGGGGSSDGASGWVRLDASEREGDADADVWADAREEGVGEVLPDGHEQEQQQQQQVLAVAHALLSYMAEREEADIGGLECDGCGGGVVKRAVGGWVGQGGADVDAGAFVASCHFVRWLACEALKGL